MSVPSGPVSVSPPAGLDRRFYAFAIDRLIAWPVLGGASYLGYQLSADDGRVWLGVLLVVGVVVLLWLASSVMVGLFGTSPGKAAMGLRVVSAEGGTPIGLPPALLRTLVLGVAALPTFGFGVAALAQTAVMDRGRQRRGWHDHLSHGVVVDVRPPEQILAAATDEAPRQVVNLTAMRLAPAPASVSPPTPPRRRPTAPEAPVEQTDHPAPAPAAAVPPPFPPGVPPGRAPRPPGPPPPAGPPPPTEPLLTGPPPTEPLPRGTPPGPPPAAPPAPGTTTPRVAFAPSVELERTVVRGAAGPQSGSGAASWRVTFDTGETFLVEGLGLVGRRPEGRPGEPVRHLVPLPSEDLSVSKTHAQFQVASDGVLVVMDRGSTNGSMLVRSGVARDLPPGKPTTLLTGDVVRFGDRTMTVVRES